MHRMLPLLLLSLSACTATYGVRGGSTTPPPPPRYASGPSTPAPPPPTSGGPAYGPGEDRHWFTDDDYLVSTDNGAVKEAYVAKLLTPPQGDTKNEARFLLFNGKEKWTSMFYLSRVADPGELAVGMPAFCHVVSTYRSQNNSAPHNKQDARTNKWVLAAVTDTSELYKGRVSIGRFSCPVGAVRVPR